MKKGIMLGLAVIVLICVAIHSVPVSFLTIAGHSMEPAITNADIIAVIPSVDPDELEVGDVLVYTRDNGDKTITIVHRIIAIDESGIATKGDSNDKTDSDLVKPADIIGIFWFKIPHLGSFIRFANTDTGYLSLILIPAAILIIIEIRKIVGYLEEI